MCVSSIGRALMLACLGLSWVSDAAKTSYEGFDGGIFEEVGVGHPELGRFPKTPLFPVLPLVVSQIIASDGDERCRHHSETFLRELRNFTLWAVQMFDASTKFPDGIVSGNSYHMGNFDQCVYTNVDLSENAEKGQGTNDDILHGQYCLAEISFKDVREATRVRNYTLDPYSMKFNPKQTAWDRLRDTGDPTKSRRDVIHWALCIPASCSQSVVEDSLAKTVDWFSETYGKDLQIQVRIPDRMCQTDRRDEYLSVYDIVFSAVSAGVLFLVFFATIYDVNSKDSSDDAEERMGFAKKMILCFSARRNFKNIFEIKTSEHGMDCIHGTRFMSMLLIIMGHRIKTSISGPLFNPEVVEEAYRRPFGALLINGLIIVDTFFLFGGLLTTYFLLVELNKRKSLNLFSLCILRFIRLTPVYLMVVFFHATIFHKIGSGPLWESRVGLERDRCMSSWWSNLLYINNYVKADTMCMFQSWYMSCDMHFFIISLVIVYFLWKKPKIGYLLLGLATILSMMIPFMIIYLEEKEAMLLPYISNLKDVQTNDNFIHFYIKSHNRAGPYMVGIITGLFLYKLHNSKYKISKIPSHIGFTSCLILGAITMISGYLFYFPGNNYNALESAFYGSFFRISWAASIGFGLFIFIKGDLGFVQNALQWKPFIPLSRLTYCAYLIHSIVQLYYVGTLRKSEYGTVTLSMWQTAGDVFATFFFSLILCLTIEAPTRALEKLILRKRV